MYIKLVCLVEILNTIHDCSLIRKRSEVTPCSEFKCTVFNFTKSNIIYTVEEKGSTGLRDWVPLGSCPAIRRRAQM